MRKYDRTRVSGDLRETARFNVNPENAPGAGFRETGLVLENGLKWEIGPDFKNQPKGEIAGNLRNGLLIENRSKLAFLAKNMKS